MGYTTNFMVHVGVILQYVVTLVTMYMIKLYVCYNSYVYVIIVTVVRVDRHNIITNL